MTNAHQRNKQKTKKRKKQTDKNNIGSPTITLKQHLLVNRVLMHTHYACLNLVFFHVVKAIKRGKE